MAASEGMECPEVMTPKKPVVVCLTCGREQRNQQGRPVAPCVQCGGLYATYVETNVR